MAVRVATASDLDALTQILVACFNDEPSYPYRYPARHQYAAQYADYCRRKCTAYIETGAAEVYEITNAPRWRPEKQVVAFSVWQHPKAYWPRTSRSQTWPRCDMLPSSDEDEDLHKVHKPDRPQQLPTPGSNTRPKQITRIISQPKPFAREDRCQAFRHACKAAKADVLDKEYEGGYMFLKLLLCHPDHRRRGSGTALVKRGVSVARVQGFNTVLFASPMGVHLYQKLGFLKLRNVEVKVKGDDEKLDMPAMVYRPPNPVRSRRGSRYAAEVMPNGLRKAVTNNAMSARKV